MATRDSRGSAMSRESADYRDEEALLIVTDKRGTKLWRRVGDAPVRLYACVVTALLLWVYSGSRHQQEQTTSPPVLLPPPPPPPPPPQPPPPPPPTPPPPPSTYQTLQPQPTITVASTTPRVAGARLPALSVKGKTQTDAKRELRWRTRALRLTPPIQLSCPATPKDHPFPTCCEPGALKLKHKLVDCLKTGQKNCRRLEETPANNGQGCLHDPNYTPCTGSRRSSDSIVFVAQKKHSTYEALGDASHNTFGALTRAIASLRVNLPYLNESDVLIWHEGDFEEADIPKLGFPPHANPRLCLLSCCSGWGAPPGITKLPYFLEDVSPLEHWAPGYLFMIRWYAVTMWSVMSKLGYKWVMRMDDDSVLGGYGHYYAGASSTLKPISYNLFESMRTDGHLYGWRQLAEYTPRVCYELKLYRNATPELHPSWAWEDFCERHTRLGFYNNWFVTSIDWWLSERPLLMQKRFDESKLIFSRRLNDLVFHSVLVHTLMPPRRRKHFRDFAYEHVTVYNGTPVVGGLETGYANEREGARAARAFKRKYKAGVVRNCSAPETAAVDAPLRRTLSVAHHGCPICEGPFPFGELGLPVLSERAISLPLLWAKGEAAPWTVDRRKVPHAERAVEE